MNDTPDPIPAALTPEQWAERTAVDQTREDGVPYIYDGEFGVGVDTYFMPVDPAEAIALANAALPDTDPRKITREMVDRLKSLIQPGEDDEQAFLDALKSYLPPKTP
jgi:hypothetical protein